MKNTIEAQPWAMAQMAEENGWAYNWVGYGNPTQGTYLYEYELDTEEE